MTKKKTKQKKSSVKDLVPVVDIKQGEINFNKEKVEKALEKALAEYKDFEVTEDNLGEAKKKRAEVNKLVKKMNRIRIDKKKEWMKPYKDVEDDIKELTAKAENVVEGIDSKVKEYDEKRKQEKIELAENIIEERKELADLPDRYLNRIEFKDSFSNLSTSQKAIEEDVDSQIELLEKEWKVEQDNIKVIEDKIEKSNEKIEGKLYAKDYIEKLSEETSLSDVLGMIDDRVEEIKEEEDDQEESKEEVEEEKDEKEEVEDEKDDEEKITAELTVVGTEKELSELKDYLVDNNIEHQLNK